MPSAVAAPARLRSGERGQAMIEFALAAPLFLMLVLGVVQFGLALNYWLDMQRIANQGARWAAVNCGQSAQPPATYNPCNPSLTQTLEDQALSEGLASTVTVTVCYPSGLPPKVGDPVKVRLEAPFTLVPILGIGTLSLGADATMRLEQVPSASVSAPGSGAC